MPSVEKIRHWHGDACHICGQPMRFKKKKTGFLNASIDHATPQAFGGTSDQNNLLLAHRICNTVRGHNDVTDELRDACAVLVRAMRNGSHLS